MSTRARWISVGTLLLAAAGCDKKIVITYYPPFYSEQIRRVGVLPFSSEGQARRGGGTAVADATIDALAATGAYEVVSGPEFLKSLQAAGYRDRGGDGGDGRHYGPGTESGTDRESLVAAAAKTGTLDAVLIGRVVRFEAGAMLIREVEYYDNGPYWDRYDRYPSRRFGGYRGRGYYGGYYGSPTYYAVRHSEVNRGTAGGAVWMIRVSDGKVLANETEAVTVTSQGPAAELSPEQCLGMAARELGARFAHGLTPSPREIGLDPGKTVRTARLRDGGGYQYTEDFKSGEQSVGVVVRLPDHCDRNTFGLVLTPKGDKQSAPLWQRTFTWHRGDREQRFEIPLAAVPAEDKDREYAIQFLYQDREVFDRKFKVKR